jgi:hypothetical protein
MLTGRRALEGDSIQEVFCHLGALDPDVLASAVEEPFATVLRSALRPDPAGRSLSMSRISDMLHQV